MATLVLENLRKFFPGNVCAVDELSLSAADGELLVLCGPSGCGKTTTLRMIAGLEKATCGTISIEGRTVSRVAAKDRDVAMVFQNYALYPHLSVYGNLAFGLKMRRLPKAEIDCRVGEAAQLLRIGSLLGRRPAELSGGERQRVALGRAMVRRPKVFLFDEPLSNLDAPLRAEMRREIGRLHQRPANRFVAGLIGSPTMNFIDGRIERADGTLLFRADEFVLPVAEAKQSALEPYIGRSAVLGIRPEHVRIRAVVERIETLGPESHVYLKTGCHEVVARIEAGQASSVGQSVDAAVAMEHAHFFDTHTEVAIG